MQDITYSIFPLKLSKIHVRQPSGDNNNCLAFTFLNITGVSVLYSGIKTHNHAEEERFLLICSKVLWKNTKECFILYGYEICYVALG